MTKPKQTKKAKVRAMLERADGATLDAICMATGWQAHSARAVLSGLRKAGYVVDRSAPSDGKAGASRYRITASPAAAK
jgi:predicted ArsR family transcriptional regulator